MICHCRRSAAGEPDETPFFSAASGLRSPAAFRLSRCQAANALADGAYAKGAGGSQPRPAWSRCSASAFSHPAGYGKPFMKQCVPWVLAVSSLGMSGCAMLAATAEPPARQVTLGGESYLVRQITESTWTASAAASPKILAKTPATTASLRQAVERVSGCRVTDSDYSRQGTQFDAQVSCAGGLGN